MGPITLYGSFPHYLDYLAPIWLNLPHSLQGPIRLPHPLREHALTLGLPEDRLANDDQVCDTLALVAGWPDAVTYTRGPVILVEHGVGQTYGENHPSNPGGKGRERVVLFLDSNARVRGLNRAAYPSTPGQVIGFPSMDAWLFSPYKLDICTVLFKWRNPIHPASDWAFEQHRRTLGRLPEIGPFSTYWAHSHPRARTRLAAWFDQSGYESIPTLEQVCRLSQVMLLDNSSAGFQAMASGCLVGWLEGHHYPGPSANLPPRFTPLAYQLPVLYPGGPLQPFIEAVLSDTPAHQAARQEMASLYIGPLDGQAGLRGARAIQDYLAVKG